MWIFRECVWRSSQDQGEADITSAFAPRQRHYAAWILTVWLVRGKAVETSQDARQEVLPPAYPVTGNPEVNYGYRLTATEGEPRPRG